MVEIGVLTNSTTWAIVVNEWGGSLPGERREMMPTLTRYDEETDTETEITFEYNYSEGSSDYFDKSWGNWLPGDPEDFEITFAEDEDGNPVELTKEEEDLAYDAAMDDLRGRAEAAAEDAYDSRMLDLRYESRWH